MTPLTATLAESFVILCLFSGGLVSGWLTVEVVRLVWEEVGDG
jgi:hypothetical protein